MALPPLVEPSAPLFAQEIERYARQVLIPDVGVQGQRRLKNARVLVVGAGGLGSPALIYLAAAGVGTIGVADPDVVELSNLQRQVVHGDADVGRLKSESAAQRLASVNPLVRVVRHDVRIDSRNALQIIADYDLVLDGTGRTTSRPDIRSTMRAPCSASRTSGGRSFGSTVRPASGGLSMAPVTGASSRSRRHRVWCHRVPRVGFSGSSAPPSDPSRQLRL